MKYILYCAIRKQSLIQYVIYSIGTLAKVNTLTDYTIVIVTDMVKQLQTELHQSELSYKYNIKLEEISKKEVDCWIGPNRYVFRVKIKAMEYFFSKYKENVLLVDCDMYARENFDELFYLIEHNKLIMYANYGVTIAEYIKQNPITLLAESNNKKVQWHNNKIVMRLNNFICEIDENQFPLLSCTIGMNYVFKDVIEEVLIYCDNIFTLTGLYTTEEIAFMLVLQKYGKILLSTRYFGTSKSEKWIRQIIGYLCNMFSGSDEEEFQEMLSDTNLMYLFNIKIPYSDCALRYLMSIIYARLHNLNVNLDTILITGVQNHFIQDNKLDHNAFRMFYHTYIT